MNPIHNLPLRVYDFATGRAKRLGIFAGMSFKALFSNLHIDLLRFAQAKLGNLGDAEDVVQDTFHNVLKQGSAFDSVENQKAYIYKTAHNLAISRMRKRQQEFGVPDTSQEPLAPSAEQQYETTQSVKAVVSELNRLPQKTRDMFLLNRMQGKSYGEIAEQYQVSIKAVEKHMSKALKHLRDKVEY